MSRSGKVQTVLGLVDPGQLGRTLTHEHLLMNFDCSRVDPPLKGDDKKTNIPFTLENSGWIRQYPYSHNSNLHLDGKEVEEAIVEEMKYFKANGGGTIVENTTVGIDRDLKFMVRVSNEARVHVVSGTGYYTAASNRKETQSMTVEQMADVMKTDIEQGCDGTDIKCGAIGELGCSWPLEACEKKVLQAGAEVQSDLGCPVIIHPGRDNRAPFEIIRILQEAGGDVSKTVMSHLDRTIEEYGEIAEFASLGSYVEYDLFGIEVSIYQPRYGYDMPSDAERVRRIKYLLDEGYEDKIVVAHDVHTKHRLMKFGGHGYSHILRNVVPQMLRHDYTQAQVDKILIENPKAWLTFK